MLQPYGSLLRPTHLFYAESKVQTQQPWIAEILQITEALCKRSVAWEQMTWFNRSTILRDQPISQPGAQSGGQPNVPLSLVERLASDSRYITETQQHPI